MWLEASSCSHPDLEVLNTVVDISGLGDDSDEPVMMSVLIKACSGCNVAVGPTDIVCSMRVIDSDCEQALTDFRIARLASEAVPNVETETDCFDSVPETGPGGGLARIATSRYRTATRAEDQARLFPALEAEIKTRREQMELRLVDQSSVKYKAHICAKVKAEHLCLPEPFEVFGEYLLKPFSDRFWDDGCPAPQVKGFKAHLDMKPSAALKYRQPYRLSKFDEARLKFLYEEAEAEGKVERYGLGERPLVFATPVIMVDKKGSLIGRRVGDFRELNLNTEDYYYPAPDAEAVLQDACGKECQTTLDCV